MVIFDKLKISTKIIYINHPLIKIYFYINQKKILLVN